MFDLDSLFLESAYDDDYVEDASIRTTEEGFVWCDCTVDEANVISGDPFDFITEAMYQNVINANNISMAILADNYKYLRENGCEMVYESEEQKEKKENVIIAFFKKIKEKIVKFFETIVFKMQHLQAKFLMLFKKARETAKENLRKVDEYKSFPSYSPKRVVDWAEMQFKNLQTGNRFDGAKTTEDFPDKDQKGGTTFETEMSILKNYGGYIKDIKKMKNSALKAIDVQKKNSLDELKKDSTRNPLGSGDAKDVKKDYAKLANAVVAVSKDAISLIMTRVNAGAKLINKAIGYKPDTEKKKATGESASFLGRLQMI